MYRVSFPTPTRRGWRRLTLLFAGVLMLGLIHPATASAAPAQLLVKDATVAEHSAHATVRVVLTSPQHHRVSVHYRTLDGTAKAGADYRAVAGKVVLPAGTAVARIKVPLLDDALDEATETFRVRIFDPAHAGIVDRTGTVRILDDDPRPSATVGDVSAVEPDSGSTTMAFPVTLSAPSGRTASVAYTVTAGTATAGSDYSVASTSGRLFFPAGATARSIRVSVLGDQVQEPSETVLVTLSAPVHLTIADGSATGTILDTDQPVLTVDDSTVTEGETAGFVVDLSKPALQTVTFHYATADGTATAPGDYTATSGTGTIPAGSSSLTVKVPTTEDAVNEPTESFLLRVSDVTGAAVADGQAKGTILDDDPLPSLSVRDTHAVEGNHEIFPVTLSRASGVDVSVEWSTADGTAKAPADYVADHGTLTIPAGHLSGQIVVRTVDDRVDEVDQTFSVHLSGPHHATIADGYAVALILDDDGPAVSIGDAHATEGSHVVFPVTLARVSAQDVKVDWATKDGTAKAPGDYTAAHGTVTIPAGHLTEQVSVATVPDAVDEPDETFLVTLSHPVHAWIHDGSAVGLIVDDDPPNVAIGNGTAVEGSPVVFTVTLSSTSGKDVKVDWATKDGTATVADSDYTTGQGTLTIPAGQLTGSITIATGDDHKVESDETFTVTLSKPVDATLNAFHTTGTGTIQNND